MFHISPTSIVKQVSLWATFFQIIFRGRLETQSSSEIWEIEQYHQSLYIFHIIPHFSCQTSHCVGHFFQIIFPVSREHIPPGNFDYLQALHPFRPVLSMVNPNHWHLSSTETHHESDTSSLLWLISFVDSWLISGDYLNILTGE